MAFISKVHAHISTITANDVAKHFLEFSGIWTHLDDGILSLAQFCRTHHFHSLSDLLSVLNRFNAVTYFL